MATASVRLPERWREAVMQEGPAFSDFAEVPDDDAAREHLLMNLAARPKALTLRRYETRWKHSARCGRKNFGSWWPKASWSITRTNVLARDAAGAAGSQRRDPAALLN